MLGRRQAVIIGSLELYERVLLFAACLLACGTVTLRAQGANFAGAQAGVSTLSADGRSIITGTSTSISLYKPENGPTFQALFGRHLSNYLSVQASYGWNRNSLTLTSSQSSEDRSAFYEQTRAATQHAAVGELLLYFRKQRRSVRPYLSVGGGAIHVASSEKTISGMMEAGIAAPGGFSSTKPAIRVAVGIDLFIKGGWAFRFTFSETIRRNAISAQLTPAGQRNLANFQNFFGFVKTF